ncbi:MAG: glutathione S-transferase [Symploca sp. SIO1B1]|nr:glutathione S-transferase [Symploca sp. SIO1B1]
MQNQQKSFRLITIPASNYCEKVRWALDILKLSYVEEPHMPPFHRFATTKVGGNSVPVLVTENGIFTDSTDILKYLDSIAPNDAKLYPMDSEKCQEVEELEELFDTKLAPQVRLWSYFYLMNNSNFMKKIWCQGVPDIEKLLFPIVLPAMKLIITKKYNINSESAAQAYEQIKSIFEKVEGLLADGRKYLMGDKISAADITFGSFVAPIIQLRQYHMKSYASQELPLKMVSEVKDFTETYGEKFVLSIYAAVVKNRNKK